MAVLLKEDLKFYYDANEINKTWNVFLSQSLSLIFKKLHNFNALNIHFSHFDFASWMIRIPEVGSFKFCTQWPWVIELGQTKTTGCSNFFRRESTELQWLIVFRLQTVWTIFIEEDYQ